MGSALPLVLVFVVVIGALVGALVAQARGNFVTTRVTRGHQEKVYAANAALEYATQRLRQDPTLCPSSNVSTPTSMTGVPQFAGRDVNISCTATSGAAAGPGGWALFVTGTSGTTLSSSCSGFLFFTCSSAPKRIVGPVYNGGGWNLSDYLTVQDGFVVQGTSGACPAQPSLLRINPSGLNGYRCNTPLPTPPAPWSLAELAPTIPAAAPAPTNPSGCRVFSPGRYTAASPMTLANGQNYLRSGVYLLDNTNLTVTSGQTLVGGRPNNGDSTDVAVSGSCLTAQQADTGNGVVILLAGNANMTGLLGSLELFSYRPDPTSPRPPISVYQLSSAEITGWALGNANTPPSSGFSIGDFFGASSWFNARISVHGALYVPRSGVSLAVYDTVQFPVGGGIVASTFSMQVGVFTNSTVEFGVRSGASSQQRTVRVNVAVLPKSGVSEKPVLGIADVVISNDSARSVSIASWRINEDTDLSTPTG